MTGVRRVLDNAANRALAAPPTRAQEATYTALWLGTTATACLLLWLADRWSRP